MNGQLSDLQTLCELAPPGPADVLVPLVLHLGVASHHTTPHHSTTAPQDTTAPLDTLHHHHHHQHTTHLELQSL